MLDFNVLGLRLKTNAEGVNVLLDASNGRRVRRVGFRISVGDTGIPAKSGAVLWRSSSGSGQHVYTLTDECVRLYVDRGWATFSSWISFRASFSRVALPQVLPFRASSLWPAVLPEAEAGRGPGAQLRRLCPFSLSLRTSLPHPALRWPLRLRRRLWRRVLGAAPEAAVGVAGQTASETLKSQYASAACRPATA